MSAPVVAVPLNGQIVQEPWRGPETSPVGAPGILTPGGVLRISRYPQRLVRLAQPATIQPGENLLPFPVIIPAPGQIRLAGAVEAGSVFTVSVDGGTNFRVLNGGMNLAPGVWAEFTITVVEGDEVKISVNQADTVLDFRAVYVTDVL